ncbi:MAG: peptidase [Candidatus Aminicenantes bacterium]|nr:peptidase [Candidatus Aminicenantes bacterium]
MNRQSLLSKSFLFLFVFSLCLNPVLSQTKITTPEEQFGHKIGDDYWLATYTQLKKYWQKLAQESDRMILRTIGKTEEGRDMVMAIITSPENHKNLETYKAISRKLALAQDITEEEARDLSQKGKAVVWIDGGLHATEVVGAQQELELVYQMVSMNDPETLRILDNVILLALITNPDGMDLVGNWYMRHKDPEKRSTRNLPRLYQKYVGHDNNRDFYMVTQKETEAVCRILYREWFPQIVYNHHQTGPSGCVLFAPPFKDPHSYNLDPLLVLGITTVGNAMHSRLVKEGKPGSTMREGAWYQTWWNGCLRCTPYFHNMIGILTEMIGNPTPIEIPFRLERQLSDGDNPYPIAPQKWHMRQSIEYSISADRAILDLAAKLKEDFLFNIFRMGKNSIEKGSQDHWTVTPRELDAVKEAIKQDKPKMEGSGRSRGYPVKYYEDVLHKPEFRNPRGFIIPSDQPDFLTAQKFINTLIKNGIQIHRATDSFKVNGKTYPKETLVVKTAQAFRPHIIDMFEPQYYPDDLQYPGGPPQPPYDSAGYTLAFQMGVQFDRILDGFDGPFEEINDEIKPSPGKVLNPDAKGFLLGHQTNDSFKAINRLLKSGEQIFWVKESITSNQKIYPPGTMYIPARTTAPDVLQNISTELGLDFIGINENLEEKAYQLSPVRIGLWDQYGGSMASGWIRWILEQFEFDFEVVFPPELDKGNLNDKFDVLIFVSRSIPGESSRESRYDRQSSLDLKSIPEKYRDRLGRVTQEKTIPKLHEFLKQGGHIITIGSATDLAYHLDLPVEDALVEKVGDGKTRPLTMEKYFIPGSILKVKVNNTNPLAYGMPEKVNVYFNRSPVFRLATEAAFQELEPVSWFDEEESLMSGWAMGQQYLKGGIAVLDAKVGKGRLFLLGPEVTFRAQPHGTFKFLFNGIFYSGLK